jgi:predicted metalloprotease
VLASTEDTWNQIFSEAGNRYPPPKLVLFTNSYPTACGMGQSAAGPFYCPPDRKVYIDLHFYQLMRDRFHASGDFAQAYVIAHEVGHHVQNLLGITDQLDKRRGRVSQEAYNALSVGWNCKRIASRVSGPIAPIEPNISSIRATSIRRCMRRQQSGMTRCKSNRKDASCLIRSRMGPPRKRVRWLRQGLERGDVKSCDTFSAAQL